MKPISVLRTLEEQEWLYAKGRTRRGRIVTQADGKRFLSRHQLQWRHGELAAHAVDLGLFTLDGFYVSDASPYADLPGIAADFGIKSGKAWGDIDHVECLINVPSPLGIINS